MGTKENFAKTIAWHLDSIRNDDDIENIKERLKALEVSLLSETPHQAVQSVVDKEYADL